MGKFSKILKSFYSQDILNPYIWPTPNEINDDVREHLLDVAYEFIEFLNVDIIVDDIIVTGSLANYNWSKYSDIDLHVLADYNQFPPEQLELYKELFKLKKTLFNTTHDIKIFDYEVELYVQDVNETHFSSGMYSILTNEWIVKPEKEHFRLDKGVLMSKVENWMSKIDEILKDAEEYGTEDTLAKIDLLKDKLKEYRSSGLSKTGEYSYENLVFKFLRRNGYIEKLFNFETWLRDKELSLDK